MARSLLELKTNLKNVPWGDEKPLITKDINNPPDLKGLSLEASKRLDDTTRITKLLSSKPGFKWIAHQALLEQGKTKNKVEESVGEFLINTFRDTVIGVGAITASTLAQVPLSGTGARLYRGFNPPTYLKTTAGDNIYGASLAQAGSPITILNRGGEWQAPISSLFSTKSEDLYKKDSNLESLKNKLLNSLLNTIDKKLSTSDSKPSDTETYIGEQVKYSSESGQDQIGGLYSDLEQSYKDSKQGTKEIYFKDTSKGLIRDGDAPKLKKKISEVDTERYEYKSEFRLKKLSDKWGNRGLSRIKGDKESRPDELQLLDVKQTELLGTEQDIIPFEFKIITPDDTQGQYLYFRAFLDSLNDNFQGRWEGNQYTGRAEEFLTYSGFARSISFGFKIAAFSEVELKPLYKKLNYLAGTTAPTYGNNNTEFMRGTIIQLTVGDYLIKQYGVVENLDINWSIEVPWEINSESPNTGIKLIRVPHMLSVSVSFRPIHNFNTTSNITDYIAPKLTENS